MRTMTAHHGAPLPLLLPALLGAALLVTGPADVALAANIPPRPETGAVLDQADILSDSQEDALNRQIADRNKDSEYARVAVLTVNGIDEDIEDYSRDVATTWGVGDAGKNNGVLIVADMGDRDLRIEVADGAREVLSDSRAEDIMEDQLTPGFKDGEYAQAFTETVDAVYDQANPDAAAAAERKSNIIAAVAIGIGLLAALVVGISAWWAGRRRQHIREQADREIEQFQREHPDEEITDGMREAYYKYRLSHRKGPSVNDKPVKAKDSNGVEREVQYAPTFQAWMPLYLMYPAIYSGQNSSDGSSSFGTSSSGGSFGGGAGFSGGGASGSF